MVFSLYNPAIVYGNLELAPSVDQQLVRGMEVKSGRFYSIKTECSVLPVVFRSIRKMPGSGETLGLG